MIGFTTCYLAILLSSAALASPVIDSASSSVGSSAPSSAIDHLAASSISASSTASSAAVLSSIGGTAASTSSAASSTPTVPFISLNPNDPVWANMDATDPQPERGTLGASILGPTDTDTVLQNPDLTAPPTTDAGSVGNAKWPFSLSHNRLQTGGWARQQNVQTMPLATNMAGVNMRLEAGAVRELHWHKTSEWAYVLKGTTQVTSVNQNGQNFVANVGPGDLWYFPPGIPHSLQATSDDPDGSEFLLVFDSGDFSEDDTFLLTDWLAHVPAEVLAKNFQTDISTFSKVPAKELYIFPSDEPGSPSQAPVSPQGTVPSPFTFAFSQVTANQVNGGSYKIVDSTTFNVSKTIAAAEVTLQPGAMRELHWHPSQDEWSFFLEGQARVTIFAAQSNARTFDYQAGDIGYVPATMGHYVENIGNTSVRFLEIFNTEVFADVSLSNWLALTPPELVKAHLGFDDAMIATLPKKKPVVVGPTNSTTVTSTEDEQK
ncbi:oxalate decarboxylase [Crepidotus variabilis]|uniref:Oxalate decarboxylase n=1 Tax=Crepidotus variabilis TaxID=179855 RepID=A0A9P6JT34_9AGAR|nr:oxalate decarboxylase [Crepidotus variabilis]